MVSRVLLPICVLIAISAAIYAGVNHRSATDHTMNHGENVALTEGGQAGLAAIIEIVDTLEQDDETDWSRVKIDTLRTHLLDMDRLFSQTTTAQSLTGDKLRFDISGSGDAIESIHRMVPAHARFIEQSRGWKIETTRHPEGVVLTVTADKNATLSKLRALGFYGFMALDSHHQQHHYQMARGMSH